mmetsp:Transcript_35464/g.102132  ORF Transcript_35464/g.102132 Transcript_35464/m.102132 type:complete len:209 (-) Transcript_35464:815-1441(-)
MQELCDQHDAQADEDILGRIVLAAEGGADNAQTIENVHTALPKAWSWRCLAQFALLAESCEVRSYKVERYHGAHTVQKGVHIVDPPHRPHHRVHAVAEDATEQQGDEHGQDVSGHAEQVMRSDDTDQFRKELGEKKVGCACQPNPCKALASQANKGPERQHSTCTHDECGGKGHHSLARNERQWSVHVVLPLLHTNVELRIVDGDDDQ